MKLYYIDENGENKPYYMGCYGIGLGRIAASLIENNIIRFKDKVKGFYIPINVAPYKVHIIYNENNKEKAEELYNYLQDNNIKAIIDDREELSIGNRINDVYVLGTPKMIVLGNRFDNENYEIEDTKTEEKKKLTKEELIMELKK